MYREAITKTERSLSLQEAPVNKSDVPIHLRSQSTIVDQNALNNSGQHRRVRSNPSDLTRDKFLNSPPHPEPESDGQSTPQIRGGNLIHEYWDDPNGLSRNSFRSSFRSSRFSTYSSIGMAEGSFSPFVFKDVRIVGSELSEPPPSILVSARHVILL